jgi:intracellular septation protein
MKFLFDVFPIILFFISYNRAEKFPAESQQLANQFLSQLTTGNAISIQMAPILLATTIAITASILQIIYLKIRNSKIDLMLWISFATIIIFGSATIYFQNDVFIRLKPTIIYWCNAAGFLISNYIFKKNILKVTMEKEVALPDQVWDKLNLAWVGFFIVMGGLNLYVAFHYEQATWVTYKLYSLASLPLFLIIQGVFLAKHMEEPQ